MRELIIQNWIFIATGTFLAILGILVQKLRLYSLIAGYNTSSAKTKQKVNIGLVAIALRNALLIIAVVWIFIPIITDLLNLNLIIKIMLVLIGHIGITIWLIWLINNNENYKIKPENMNN